MAQSQCTASGLAGLSRSTVLTPSRQGAWPQQQRRERPPPWLRTGFGLRVCEREKTHKLFRAVAHFVPPGSEATRAVNMCIESMGHARCRRGSEVLRYVQKTSRVPHA